jgi:hypothetical protein
MTIAHRLWCSALLVFAVSTAAAPRGTQAVAELILGAWTTGGPSFDMLIQETSILFEFDMKEHPYRLDGQTLIIDFQDPALGVQRKRILRVTANELEIEDEQSGARETLTRMRDNPDSEAAIGWVGLYSDAMIAWLENGNAGGPTVPRWFRFVLRSAPNESAPAAGTLAVIADPKAGLRALFEPAGGGVPVEFTPDVFDTDWGYGPYFHQTYRSQRGSWFELPPGPFPRSVWINTRDLHDQPRLLALTAGDIVTGPLGDALVIRIDADAILIRPEQAADMWCRPEPPPPLQPLEPRRVPRAELYSRDGHLLMRPKYLRGC